MKISSGIVFLSVVLFASPLFAGIADITGPTTLQEGDLAIFSAVDKDWRLYFWSLDEEVYTTPGIAVYEYRFNDNAQHTLYLKVIDPVNGITDTSQHSFEVTNVSPQDLQKVSVQEVSANVYQVTMEFTDVGTDDTHTYQVKRVGETIIDNASIPYEEQSTHTFSFTRTYYITSSPTVYLTVNVFDDDGGSAQCAFSFVVKNYAPTVTLDVPEISLSGEEITLKATITDPNLNEYFDMVVGWGDGTSSNKTHFQNKKCSFKHTYSGAGTYNGYVRVEDNFVSNTEYFTVNVPHYKPVFTVKPTYYVQEDKTFSLNIPFVGLDNSCDVSIHWGDGNTTEYTTSSNEINRDHVYTDPGEYDVTVTVGDGTMSGEMEAVVVVKAVEFVQINRAAVITSWEPVPGKKDTVYFSDDQGDTFHIMGKTTDGYMIDAGDPDGYDDIPGNDDDRPAPSDTIIRLYRVD